MTIPNAKSECYWESKDGKYAGTMYTLYNNTVQLVLDLTSKLLLCQENNARLRKP